jgi:polar amino acid transport system substrate-binding protein
MALNNPMYSEHPHPKDTTYLMLSDNKDVRVGDINIFWHDLNNKHYEKIEIDQFQIHYLWPDVFSHIAFKDPVLKDAVDNVIAELRLNGKIKEIYTAHKLK